MICSTTSPRGLLNFPRAGRCRDINDLIDPGKYLFELERPVVIGGREAEAIFDERLFARPVAVVHGVKLGKRLVRFVDEEDKIFGKII